MDEFKTQDTISEARFNGWLHANAFVPFDSRPIDIISQMNTFRDDKLFVSSFGILDASSKAVKVLENVDLSKITNSKLRENLSAFLQIFVSELQAYGVTDNTFPQMQVVIEDDNVFLNWVFSENLRLGFTIVEMMSSSSWFLFKKSNAILGSLSGELDWDNCRSIIRWHLQVVMENT